jgi:Skp family chaperone for outer membrane proteins
MKTTKWILLAITAVIVATSAPALQAADPAPADPAAPAVQKPKLTKEQMEARRQKMITKYEADLAELQKKKDAGTLTDKETKRYEHFKELKANNWRPKPPGFNSKANAKPAKDSVKDPAKEPAK